VAQLIQMRDTLLNSPRYVTCHCMFSFPPQPVSQPAMRASRVTKQPRIQKWVDQSHLRPRFQMTCVYLYICFCFLCSFHSIDLSILLLDLTSEQPKQNPPILPAPRRERDHSPNCFDRPQDPRTTLCRTD
jgi:hypothetical protein